MKQTAAATKARPAPQAETPGAQARRPPEFRGTLVVRSVPAGAAVLVDRQHVGTTPIDLPKLRAGSHTVWIEHEGYQRWTAAILVPADKLTRVNVSLVRDSGR